MKNIKYMLITLVLAGCINSTGNRVLDDSKSGIDDQMENISTRAQVKSTFGRPNLIFDKDGVETYEYKRIDGSGRHVWLVPIFGYVLSWIQDDYSYEETNLFVRFDGDKVKDYQVVQSGGTTN